MRLDKTDIRILDKLAASINDPGPYFYVGRAVLDDGCEWTNTKLVHEIISNLEGLQGCWIEWKTESQDYIRQDIIRFHAADGQVFRLKIDLYEDYWADEFDQSF